MPTSHAPHTWNYISYERHVGQAARSIKTHRWLLGLDRAKFSLHEKWNDFPHDGHPCLIVSAIRTKRERSPENILLNLTLEFYGWDINSLFWIHSFFSSTSGPKNGQKVSGRTKSDDKSSNENTTKADKNKQQRSAETPGSRKRSVFVDMAARHQTTFYYVSVLGDWKSETGIKSASI